jgi:hypothetical protein
LNEKEERFSRTTQNLFVIDKIKNVLNYMRKLRFSLLEFLQEVVNTKSIQKQQIIWKLELFRFFVFNFNDVLNLVNWKREKYRKKLRFLFENKYFNNWKVENMKSFETNLITIIEEIKACVSHLLFFLRFIITVIDQKFERWNMKKR